MQAIQWSSEYAVGIAEVDTQHHALINMINALSARIGTAQEDDTTRDLLHQLADYTRFHFGLEERLMTASTVSAEFVARHRGEHAYFIGVLKDFSADFMRGKGKISSSLLEYLMHWLLHHIMVVDHEMARHLNASDPHIDEKLAASLADTTTLEFTDAERQLLNELQHSNAELKRQLQETTAALDTARTELAALRGQLAAR